jgi:hypothetical protein
MQRRRSAHHPTQSAPGEHLTGVAAYNHSLNCYLPVYCFCSKSAAKSPALVAVSVDRQKATGSAFPNARIPPVSPVLSGRDQAFTNSLIENP